METHTKLLERWRYLRGLLSEQLGAFESGGLRMHTGGENVSADAVAKLREGIAEFDALIAADEADRVQAAPNALS